MPTLKSIIQRKWALEGDASARIARGLKEAMDHTTFTQKQLLEAASRTYEHGSKHVQLMDSSSQTRKRLIASYVTDDDAHDEVGCESRN